MLYILSRFDVSLSPSLSNYRWNHFFHELGLDNRLELKCVPLEDLFRTKPGVKSTQVRSVKEPDITDLWQVYRSDNVCL